MTTTLRRLSVLVAAVALLLTVGWAAFARGRHHAAPVAGGHTPSAASSTSAAPTGSPASAEPVSVPSSSRTAVLSSSAGPETVATAFVQASQSLDWRWASPAGYLPTVRPMVTPAFWASTLAPMAHEPGGATWAEFKNGHGVWTASISLARVITEAGRSPTGCIVRVVFNVLITADSDHGRPGGVPETGYLNVSMQKIGGRWLVAGRSTDGG